MNFTQTRGVKVGFKGLQLDRVETYVILGELFFWLVCLFVCLIRDQYEVRISFCKT